MKRKSKLLFLVSTALLLFALISILLFQHFIGLIQHDALTINELGLLRGSIQRYTKLELSSEGTKDIRNQIENLLNEYDQKEDQYLMSLKGKWLELNSALLAYKADPSPENQKTVIAKSEECWSEANTLVFQNQYLSEKKITYFVYPFIMLVIIIVFIFLMIYFVKRYVYDNLEDSAIFDPLTNAFNRRYFTEFLNNEIIRVARKKGGFSLIMFDIDHFKNINDTFGHDAGDDVLKNIVKLAQTAIRKKDVLSRIGGEEFVILLPDTSEDEAYALAENVRKAIEKNDFPEICNVTVSLGVVSYSDGSGTDMLLKKADQAMYEAKNNGRNRTEVAKF